MDHSSFLLIPYENSHFKSEKNWLTAHVIHVLNYSGILYYKAVPVPLWEKNAPTTVEWISLAFCFILYSFSNYNKIAIISHASKIMPQILQARFQQYVNWEILDYKWDLEKAEEPEDKLLTSIGS